MKIYITHASSFDYKEELYEPLRKSRLNKVHELILPHEKSVKLFDSRKILKSCDLILAEVSHPSTGQGIELGWASVHGIPIICLHKVGSKPSSSLEAVSSVFIEYSNDNIIEKITESIKVF